MGAALTQRWRVIAPRKVLFFLSREGRVRLADLLSSRMLDDLIGYDAAAGFAAADNWFSPEARLRALSCFALPLQARATSAQTTWGSDARLQRRSRRRSGTSSRSWMSTAMAASRPQSSRDCARPTSMAASAQAA